MDQGRGGVEDGSVGEQGGAGQSVPEPRSDVAAAPLGAQVQTTLPVRPVQQSAPNAQQGAPAQAPVAPMVPVAPVAGQPAVQSQPVPQPQAPQSFAAPTPDSQLVAAEALIGELRKLPGVVPEVIQGRSVAEVQASLEAARKAFEAVKGAVLKEQGASVPQARGGSGAPAVVPKTSLEMIEVGLTQAQARRR